ncbi:Gfo/Idh/MocA family oxidoreductase [uncultured Cohaesibacter sp.]|uniref:Gfo/Idh/MocA family protein n=1 Tax=uncultured Cohaesibacter sp. TaxID=1002546 RepID=UPI0029C809D9|nr:Gfo/Idh/MocA family oxidoreductase [uncultured Cohaesibacter sp.]
MKLAIIGLGMAAEPHIAALKELSDSISISGLYVRNADRRQAAADELGVRAFASIDAIAEDADTDAALILTPPNARKDIVTKLSAAGKHLLMEKPLERSLEASVELVEMAEKAGIVTGTVFQHRARSGSRYLAELLREKALGDIAMVRTDVPWWRPQSYYDQPGRGTFSQDGGGVLITQAIHVLDLMLSLCGPVKSVQAMLATTAIHFMETEDFATAGVVYENGAVGSICATTAGFPGDAESIRIDGTKGSAILEAGHLTLRWRDGAIEQFGEESASGGGGDPMAFPCAWHKDIIANFAESVAGKVTPICSWRDALEVQKLLDGMTRSSKLNGQRVTL